MTTDMTHLLAEYLRDNRGPDPDDPNGRCPPEYGVTGRLDGDLLTVELVFRRGRHYCCMEWGCHLGLHNGARWSKLRAAMASNAISAPPRLSLRLTCIVEDGALFFAPEKPVAGRTGRPPFAPHQQMRYEEESLEAPATR